MKKGKDDTEDFLVSYKTFPIKHYKIFPVQEMKIPFFIMMTQSNYYEVKRIGLGQKLVNKEKRQKLDDLLFK